jgi:YebC/PmpR family DNA-binding regulatory protein
MSGHSKWATTKHQKAATDAKRSNLFTKIANLISVSARHGGDPTMNFQLRLAMDKARAANMPKDKIERAIKRGMGELGGAIIEEVMYEAYGQGGTAILIETLTDNRNRTSAEIKAILNRLGGKFAGAGSVAYLFERKGEIKLSTKGQKLEDVEMAVLDSLAEDYIEIDDGLLVYSKPEDLAKVRDQLSGAGLEVIETQLVWQPKTTSEISPEDTVKVIKLMETLDNLDDVANISSNLG